MLGFYICWFYCMRSPQRLALSVHDSIVQCHSPGAESFVLWILYLTNLRTIQEWSGSLRTIV